VGKVGRSEGWVWVGQTTNGTCPPGFSVTIIQTLISIMAGNYAC